MKKEELFDIIGEVDEQKILNADKYFYEKRKTKNTWLKWGALAACLLIVSASVIGIFSKSQGKGFAGGTGYRFRMQGIFPHLLLRQAGND